VLRIIREEEPPKPSTRLSTSATLPSIACNRHCEPAALTSQVRGELDWIVMKALDKDRNRRYESAASFARDLQRYLDEEPVQAGPPSLAYKVRKLVRRNKRTVAAVAVVAVAVVAAIAAAAGSIGWVLRDRQAHTAFINREIESALREAAAAYAQERVADAVVAVNRAEGFMNSIDAEPAIRDRVRSFRADFEMLQQLRNIESNHTLVGQLAEGEAAFREVIRLRPESSFAHAALSQSLSLQGKYADAEKYAHEAIRLNPTGPFGHPYLGMILARQGRFAEAVPHFRVAVERRPNNASWRSLLAFALLRSGNEAEAKREFETANQHDKSFYFASRDWANEFAARGQLWEAAQMYAAAARARPGDLAIVMRAAFLALATGDRKAYEAICQEMLKHFGRTTDKAVAIRLFCACLIASDPIGDLDQFRRISEVAIINNPAPAGIVRNSVLEHFALALLAYRRGDWEGARSWSRQALADAKQLRSTDEEHLPTHALFDSRILVVDSLALYQMGKLAEARQAYDEALAIAREIVPYAPHFLGAGVWTDWLMYELLRREAAGMMGIDSNEPRGPA
jgi:tetratricopeptide (TPR) repeat protein